MHLSKLEHRGAIDYSRLPSALPPSHPYPSILSTLSRHLGIFPGADKAICARARCAPVSEIMISVPKENHRIRNTVRRGSERQIRTRPVSFAAR